MTDRLPLLRKQDFTPAEWLLVKKLWSCGGEWPWYMTDEEYALVEKAVERAKSGDSTEGAK